MSTIYNKTDNYSLNLYGDNDPADLRDGYNGSMQTIDTTLEKHLNRIEGVESRETHNEAVMKALLVDNTVDNATAAKNKWDKAANDITAINPKVSTLERKVSSLEEYVDVYINSFDVDHTGENDATDAIQTVIDHMAATGKTRLIFNGTYKISKQGNDTDNRPYGLRLDNLSDCVIDLNNAQFTADGVRSFNVFALHSCENMTIIDGKCKFINPSNSGRILYGGAFLYFKNCKNCIADNICTIDACYTACVHSSSRITVTNSRYEISSPTVKGYSGILIHSTDCAIVRGNYIAGNLGDGALSVYGANSRNCIVANNIVRSITDPDEGITVDAGTCDNVIEGNYVSGYNYGIDVKSLAQNNIVSLNVITHCKVGIAERPGEEGGPTANNDFSDNTVVLGSPVTSTFNPYGYGQVGMLVENRTNTTVHDNVFCVENGFDSTIDVCGIVCDQTATLTGSGANTVISIHDNKFNFNTLLNNNWNKVNKNSRAIQVTSAKFVDICDNVINFTDSEPVSLIEVKGNSSLVAIRGNVTKMSDTASLISGDGSIKIPIVTNNLAQGLTWSNPYFVTWQKQQKIIEGLTSKLKTDLCNISKSTQTISSVFIKFVATSIDSASHHVEAIYKIDKDGALTKISASPESPQVFTLSYESNVLSMTQPTAATTQYAIKIIHGREWTITADMPSVG